MNEKTREYAHHIDFNKGILWPLDYYYHVMLWKAHTAIPMWSGEWTPPEGSSMAKAYAHEITNEWRQYWIAQNAKDGWKKLREAIDRHMEHYTGN